MDDTSHTCRDNSTPYGSASPPSTLSIEMPPTIFRSLQDVYASCRFSLLASYVTCYLRAADQPERQDPMIEKIQAMENNHN